MSLLDAAAPAVPRPLTTRVQIDRYFEVSLYLLICTGFATLAATGRLDFASIVFVGAALIARGVLLARHRVVLLPDRWTNRATLIYIAFYITDFLFLSGSFVVATVHLVLFSMVVKIFSVQRDRDHLYLALLAFMEVLAAAMLTVDSVFLAAFVIFMLLAVTTFVSMEMRRSAARAQTLAEAPALYAATNGGAGRKRGLRIRLKRLDGAISATAIALMVGIFAIATVLFFMLPRVSAGYLGAFAPRNELVSGFSNDVNLGQIGVIQQSSQVVMHVTIDGDRRGTEDLKWRGTALEVFENGRHWSTSVAPQPIFRTFEGRFDVARAQARWRIAMGESLSQSHHRPLRYRVLMEPVGVNVFFVAPEAQALWGNYRVIGLDSNGTLYNDDRDRQLGAYQGFSDIGQPTADELRSAGTAYPPGITIRYLQRPALDTRIPALAEQITSNAATPYDKAAALEEYLRTHYGYTLQLPQRPVDDPLADFLFVRKEGHCEYFASAMAVMLRTVGIPSRLVNGFRNGEYNDVTGSYIVRARNAHSWVEAYFPGHGWISFDPTPAAAQPVPDRWSRMLLYVDAAREFWREWVINYDFSHQRTLSVQMTTRGRQLADDGRRWIRRKYFEMVRRADRMRERATESPRAWLGTLLAALLLLAFLMTSPRLKRAWTRRRLISAPARAPRAAAGLWYGRMTRMLARRGWRKRPSQSPREFVITIEDPEMRRRVEAFTRSYERARFGGEAEEAEALPRLYEEIAGR
jgi:protein-glutamine gamma-glutamyltransferase